MADQCCSGLLRLKPAETWASSSSIRLEKCVGDQRDAKRVERIAFANGERFPNLFVDRITMAGSPITRPHFDKARAAPPPRSTVCWEASRTSPTRPGSRSGDSAAPGRSLPRERPDHGCRQASSCRVRTESRTPGFASGRPARRKDSGCGSSSSNSMLHPTSPRASEIPFHSRETAYRTKHEQKIKMDDDFPHHVRPVFEVAVSRAQRSAKCCAAEPGTRFLGSQAGSRVSLRSPGTQDRRPTPRLSGGGLGACRTKTLARPVSCGLPERPDLPFNGGMKRK